MLKLDQTKPEQILPGVAVRVNSAHGVEVGYTPDGAGGVTLRFDWSHKGPGYCEFHIDPNATPPADAPSAKRKPANKAN
jgi:hypothetical protein